MRVAAVGGAAEAEPGSGPLAGFDPRSETNLRRVLPVPQAALHPSVVLGALEGWLAGQGRRGVGVTSEVVAASRSRPVFAYTVSWRDAAGEPGSSVVIGKGFNRGDGAAVYELM